MCPNASTRPSDALMRTVIVPVLVFRVVLALITRTFFQPDEYFQALEPAHHAVYGYGHLTWEWSTSRPIRSIIYPALYIPAYWLLKVTGLDKFDFLVIALPRVVHGLLSAGTDLGVAKLAGAVLGKNYVSTALFLSLSSFFNALALSRTLSNSLETSLCSLAFACYPWDAHPNASPHITFNRTKLRWALVFSALACMVRPTNAVIWVFLYGNILWSYHRYPVLLSAFLKDATVAVLTALGGLFAIDTFYYQKPTLTPYNFLLTNLSPVSLFYGGNPWHFYLTQALPILCTTALPFTLHGLYATSKAGVRSHAFPSMARTVGWSIGVYSLTAHKEWRFIHPLLPLLTIFAAKSLVDLGTKNRIAGANNQGKDKNRRKERNNATWLPIRQSHLTLLLLTVPVSLYVVLFYCSGPVSVLSYIRGLKLEENDTIGFLMPCHSTPAHAYIHRDMLAEPGRMWALGCEPPLETQDLSTYQDQTDIFFRNPKWYIATHFPADVNPAFPLSPFPASAPGQSGAQAWRHEWPKHLVLFGDLLHEIQGTLEDKGYREVRKYGREWEGEGKRKGAVRVWRWEGH